MQPPQLSEELEERRQAVIDEFDRQTIREDAALRRVSEAISVICEVPMAHVSLMETKKQCVVGHVGMEMESYDRDRTFCTYTIAQNEVVIVEDATDDPRFRDNPFVTREPGISFYVGLPVVVDDVPVGTMCAIDTRPRSLDVESRSELFGLLNTVESHLQVVYHQGEGTVDHGLASKLTAIRALGAQERFRKKDDDRRLRDSLRELEAETSRGFELLLDRPSVEDIELGMADTEVDLVD